MPPTPFSPAVTTIGQLVYATRPVLNFGRLVADLEAALGGLATLDREVAWDHDDVAILDLGSSRIALGMAQGPADGGITLTVTAGLGPREGRDGRLAERRHAVARLIADRIAARFPPVRTLWTESDEIATSDLLDRVTEALDAEVARAPAEVRPEPARRAGLPSTRPARILTRLEAQAELPRLLERVEMSLAARARGLGEADRLAANDMPDLPRAAQSGLESVRSALYAGPEDYSTAPSPTIRLVAHALDATLLVIALPVGAAMMTYSLVRGADLGVSARMTALCGIGVGVLHGLGGLEALRPFI